MKTRLNPWLIGGIALDVAGLALIAYSIVQGDAGALTAAGVGLLLAGTLAVSRAGRASEASLDEEAKSSAVRGWKPEKELRPAPPRRVRLTAAAQVSLMAWLVAAAFVGFFAWERVVRLAPAPPSRAVLDDAGETAEATVHRKETRLTPDGEERYSLYYNFRDAAGAGVRSSITVSKSLFEVYDEGDTIEVRYLPGDAIAHYLPELTRGDREVRAVLMAAVLAAFFLFLLESRRRLHKRLVAHGTAVPGVVESISRRGGAKALTVQAEIQGAPRTLRTTERNTRRETGDVVTVLYDPKRPADAEIYRGLLYRAAD